MSYITYPIPTAEEFAAFGSETEIEKGKLVPIKKDGSIDKRFNHGLWSRSSPHRLRSVWHGMVMRCTNPNWINYKDYGGRGIKVCERWRKLKFFVEDMAPTFQEGLCLDRIDNNGDYCKENCCWATRIEQANNTRANRHIEYLGERLTIAQWARKLGVSARLINVRLWRGWSEEKALTGNRIRIRNKFFLKHNYVIPKLS